MVVPIAATWVLELFSGHSSHLCPFFPHPKQRPSFNRLAHSSSEMWTPMRAVSVLTSGVDRRVAGLGFGVAAGVSA